jgi:hypothetical protein
LRALRARVVPIKKISRATTRGREARITSAGQTYDYYYNPKAAPASFIVAEGFARARARL